MIPTSPNLVLHTSLTCVSSFNYRTWALISLTISKTYSGSASPKTRACTIYTFTDGLPIENPLPSLMADVYMDRIEFTLFTGHPTLHVGE